jgi:DNA polymerase-3 subunit epsilon
MFVRRPTDLNKKILVIDLETDSLPKQGEDYSKVSILECGILGVDLDGGNYEVFLDTLVRPHKEESNWRESWFLRNTKVNPTEIEEAPTFYEIAPIVTGLLWMAPITAFNLKFELSILRNYGFRVPSFQWDLMIASAGAMKIPSQRHGIKYPKLEEAYEFFLPGTGWTQLHRAGDDILREAELSVELYKRGLFHPSEDEGCWSFVGSGWLEELYESKGLRGFIRKEELPRLKPKAAECLRSLLESVLSREGSNETLEDLLPPGALEDLFNTDEAGEIIWNDRRGLRKLQEVGWGTALLTSFGSSLDLVIRSINALHGNPLMDLLLRSILGRAEAFFGNLLRDPFKIYEAPEPSYPGLTGKIPKRERKRNER